MIDRSVSSKWHALLGETQSSLSFAIAVSKVQSNLKQLDELDRRDDEIKKSRKTLARHLVKEYLQKWSWYYPKGSNLDGERPSITKAWAFYEHYTLARHLLNENENDTKRIRAIPGTTEEETELYSVCNTKETELDAWGLAVVLYFNILKKISFIFLFLGILNIPSSYYFGSPEYSEEKKDFSFPNLSAWTFGAVCYDVEYVSCTNCAQYHNKLEFQKFGSEFRYRHNTCEAVNMMTGNISLFSLIVIFLGFIYLAFDQTAKEVNADEDKISSSDYSILISNPPPDAYDPEKWRDFFAQFDDHKPPLITIVLDNSELLKSLLRLRIFRQQLEKLENSLGEDEEQYGCMFWTLRFFLRPFNLFLTKDDVRLKVDQLVAEVLHLRKQHYIVKRVFVTMETEAGQRTALEALDIGRLSIWRNKPDIHVKTFNGTTVLNVQEAREPTAIRWMDICASQYMRILQMCCTYTFTVAIIAVQFLVINAIDNATTNPFIEALAINVGNFVFPFVFKFISNLEDHWAEGQRQLSLYSKITIFRWINTVVIILAVTPTHRLLSGEESNDLISKIATILVLEAFLTPTLRILDIVGTIRKHLIAPREKTQETMNSHFLGSNYNLGERYTDMTKIMFFCLFYSVIVPSTFLIGSLALAIQYWADKFCLMYIWSDGKDMASTINQFSIEYMFRFAVFFYAFSSVYFWAGFPYDNLCKIGDTGEYEYCSQRISIDFFEMATGEFGNPNWMTDDQQNLLRYYTWLAFFIGTFMISSVVYNFVKKQILPIVKGMYKPQGSDMQMDFSSLYSKLDILAYIPQVFIPGHLFPCFVCNIDKLRGYNLVTWTEGEIHKYNDYNLMNELEHAKSKVDNLDDDGSANAMCDDDNPIFSIVRHWPRFPPESD